MQIKIALVGNPNAGKTTLFNRLTGSRQHTCNYPGITVDCKEGFFYHKDKKITLTDLPGTYSLTTHSTEELITRNYIVNERPQVVINIVDASNLERNLYLTCQLLELGIPVIIALNMVDVAKDRGIEIKHDILEEFLQVPVVPIIARSNFGKKKLIDLCYQEVAKEMQWIPRDISYGKDLDATLGELIATINDNRFMTHNYPARYTAIKYLEGDELIQEKGCNTDAVTAKKCEGMVATASNHSQNTMNVSPEAIIADHRYGFIRSILRQGVVSHKFDTDRLYTSDKIDKIVVHRVIGPILMLLILFAVYKFTFTWSETPVTWLENMFEFLANLVDTRMSDGLIKSLIISGIIGGVGGVLGFVPLIMFMFFSIAILEDTGYLARVAFMLDRIFRIFGLHGSSVMPFIISGGIAGGCAVPGVMATRTLRSSRERVTTLLTVSFMNCGAKLPVLALLIGTFFSENKAQYMLCFTLLAWVVALIAAKLLRSTVLKGPPTPFIMELPPYHFPTIRGLLIHTWERTYQYIKKAGTVILTISILLWAMMTFPGLSEEESTIFENRRQTLMADASTDLVAKLKSNPANISAQGVSLAAELRKINNMENEAALQNSTAGRLGGFFEPYSQFAGFDWRTNIALLGGFAAKEVIISTLGTAYSLGEIDIEDTVSLEERLKNDPNWNKVVAVSALIFIMFYSPCFVTLACIAKESSWKWSLFSMTFNTIFAFALAVVVYQVGIFFNLG